ncbi:MAG: Polyphosphate kinase [uncultured Thermomicrobiales bacterium]|uniref:Polyphosphate kinase n=1 Tax=uncultured Thermomicrobiales bacterium TaxID=1645740 RepID=A0A6J4UKX6_9BACT|nr:MAG: Polyphosphate kinase [uncultured Thermomicrobiales bacterium]
MPDGEVGSRPTDDGAATSRRWDLDETAGRAIDHDDAEDGSGYATMASVAVAPSNAAVYRRAVPLDDSPLALPPLPPEMFINRELSWLEFNRRVLKEATEPATPILERTKFAAICSDNLDGWFMIRMAGVKRKVVAGITTVGPDGRTPTAQFKVIRQRVQEGLEHQARVIREQLIPELTAHGIEITRPDALTPDEQATIGRLFDRDIFPVLTPQGIDAGRPFPHVSGGSLNLIVVLRSEETERYARIKIPATLSSLLPVRRDGDPEPETTPVPAGHIRLVWLQDVISVNIERLFPGVAVQAVYPFHVLRDADIEPEEEDDDRHNLMAVMRETLNQRPFGPVVRIMVTPAMPQRVREWLQDQLHALPEDVYVVDGPLTPDSFFELLRLDRPDLKDPPFTPERFRFSRNGKEREEAADIFAAIRERDLLVHHPYQSFDAFVDFIRAASTDPDVVAIKQTLYRLGRNSPLIPALIDARDDDTQIAVLVELRARFDEESNIQWAEALERRGVHVAYGLAGLKTHCKATMVVRRERDGMRRYVHLGTGNYNASTARTYEDLGLFSADEGLGADVAELFNALTGFSEQKDYRKIWTAPVNLRRHILEAIANEIAAHQRTGKGHLIFKMNQLVDRDSIRALYAASRAGVRVDLIIRGICSLRPGVPGWSEHIRIFSIVGRFLEHSRIYAFANGGETDPQVYLGSADLMERNLDRRVELLFPLETPRIRNYVWGELLPAFLRDTVNAHELQPDGVWKLRPRDEDAFDVQAWLQERHGG